MTERDRPVSVLLEALEAVASRSGLKGSLERNLASDSVFQKMRGAFEPRFSEWTFELLERRALAKHLRKFVLHAADAEALAEHLGVAPADIQGLDTEEVIRLALEAIEIREAGVPPRLQDGVEQLVELQRSLRLQLASDTEVTGADGRVVEPRFASGRSGCERFLKLLAFFAWNAGGAKRLAELARKGGGRFNAVVPPPDRVDHRWLFRLGITALAELLSALTEHQDDGDFAGFPFVPPGTTFWSAEAHGRFIAFEDAICEEVHDRVTDKSERERWGTILKQTNRLLDVLNAPHDSRTVARPESVRFFRRMDVGFARHFEGWTSDADKIRFYDVQDDFELHRDYVFLAATNPSAVNAICVPFPTELQVARLSR